MTGKPNTKDKVKAIWLAALMVFSVFTLAAGFAGSAAANAPEPGQHAANSGPGDITADQDISSGSQVEIATIDPSSPNGNVRNITVNPGYGSASNGVSTADIDSITAVVEDNNGNRVSNTTSYDASTVNLSFAGTLAAQGDNTTLVQVYADTSSSIGNGDDIDAGIRIQAPDGGVYEGASPYDTAGVQTVTADTGFISGSVTSGNSGDSLVNVPVEVYRDTDNSSDITAGDTLVTTVQTNNNGVYTAEVAPGTTEYLLRVDQTGFQSFASAPLDVSAGETTTQNIVLKAEDVVTNLDAEVQGDSTVPADGQSEVTHLVELTGRIGQQTDQPIEDRQVTVDVSQVGGSDGDITIDGTTTVNPPDSPSTAQITLTTNASGQAAINVTSETVQQLDVTFSLTNASGQTLSETLPANFAEIINDGPGSIRGDVGNELTGDSIENASVYAIQNSRFSQNTQSLGPITISDYDSNDGTVAFRLINDDTGQIVDADLYRVEKTDSDDRLVKSFPLNESDSAAGNGFVYTDLDNNDDASFDITPLRSANYTLDVAPGSPPSNAGFEAASNVTTFSDTDVNLDLTQSAIESRYSGTNAVVSAQTDSRGEYTLTQLFIGQDLNGLDYVVTSTAPSFTRDFVDTTVTDNDAGQAYTDVSPREPQPADTVNITNLATIPSGEVDGERETFSNTSDAAAQNVPRDGRTLDVIRVETTNAEGVASGTVTLTVENENFDVSEGGFSAALVEDAESATTENNGRSITVVTGADGTATVYLQSDQDVSDLSSTSEEEFVGVSATLSEASGASATDQTDKLFVGVTQFELAQMRGDVTNGEDEPLLNTVVFTDRFDFGTNIAGNEEFRVDLEPENIANVGSDEIRVDSFNVSLLQYDSSASEYQFVGSEVVTADRLEGDYLFGGFENVSINSSDAGLTLVTGTGEDNSYSLPRVPALSGEDVTYQMGAIKTAAPQLGETGTSNEESVQVDTTGTADILVRGAQPTQPAFFNVSDLNPMDVTVTQGDEITVTATVTNEGDITDSQMVEFRVGGNVVANQSVTIDGGNSTTVTFENVNTAGLESGDYTHGVFTADADQTATLTVESGDGTDGQVTTDDIITAIVEYNSGSDDVTTDDIISMIVQYNSQN